MSYDLAIWKRSTTTKTAMLAEAFEALSEGRDHPAMTKFDVQGLEQALKDAFGDYDKNADCLIACAWGSTTVADWLLIQCNFPVAEEVLEKIVPIALDLELLIYDPQREVVWGNRRPQKLAVRKKK